MNSATELLDQAAYSYLCSGGLGLGLTETEINEHRSFIGGSDAPSIVAGGKAWPRLFAIKKGRRDDKVSESDPLWMQKYWNDLSRLRGNWLEPLNRAYCQIQTGRRIDRPASSLVRHPTIPYLAAHPDGISTTVHGHPCVWEAKNTSSGGDNLVIMHTSQCSHVALCCRLDWSAVSSFIGNSRWELFEQEVDPLFAAEYLDRCREFWWYVHSDREPPEDVPPLGVPAPAKPLITVYLDNKDPWPNWGQEMVDEMEICARTAGAVKAYKASHDNIKKLLPEHVGTVIRGNLKVAKDRAGTVRFSMSKNGGNSDE